MRNRRDRWPGSVSGPISGRPRASGPCPPRAGRGGSLHRRARLARTSETVDHRPDGGRSSAHDSRAKRTRDHNRRGDLQLCRIARRQQIKRILRHHLRSVQLQEIADHRDKLRYPTPPDEWLRANSGAVLGTAPPSPKVAIRAYCDSRALDRLVDHHVAGSTGAGSHLYRLLTTEILLSTCIEGASRMPVEVKHPAVERRAS